MLKMFDRLLGAHVSTAGGLQKTVERAQVLGCNCIQIFASNPRGWQSTPTSESDAHTYQQAASTHGVKTLIIHAIYLVNLASPKEEVAEKSLASMQRDLMSAKRLGALGLVLHPGSDLGDGQGVERLHKALKILLPSIPAGCRILLEGMAGTKNSIGDLETIGRLSRELGDKVGVCLDSAHLLAAGYDLPQTTGFKQLDLDIKKYIGYEKIGCIHLNDSKQPVGSHRDRHENLGEGFVGKAGLIHMLLHKPFAHLPFILETPGFDDQGPDQKNMQRMKQYVKV
jgi:deoxyribonuclease IV